MKKTCIILFVGLLALSSCQPRVAYSDFRTMPIEGWHEDSVLTFETDIHDSMGIYDVLIVVRHTNQYAYQNLWVFVDTYTDLGISQRDTIEATLADDYGRWLGSGINRYELPLLYIDNMSMPTHQTRFTIQHGMRTEWLKGITDVGVVVKVRG